MPLYESGCGLEVHPFKIQQRKPPHCSPLRVIELDVSIPPHVLLSARRPSREEAAAPLASLLDAVPEVADARFDFTDGTFRGPDDRALSDFDLERSAVAARGGGAPGAGRNSLKRGILLNTLSRAESGERPGLLESVSGKWGERVLGPRLTGTLYRKEGLNRPTPEQRKSNADGAQWGEESEARFREAYKGVNVEPETLRARASKWFADRRRPGAYRYRSLTPTSSSHLSPVAAALHSHIRPCGAA